MGQRGRKSAGSLAQPVLIEARRPPPPAELSDVEAEVWRDAVGTMPTGWFCRAQYPILVAYCRHTARASQLSRMVAEFRTEWVAQAGGLERLDKLLAMAERETRSLIACARSMRLTQQAQILPRGAGRAVANSPTAGPLPWE